MENKGKKRIGANPDVNASWRANIKPGPDTDSPTILHEKARPVKILWNRHDDVFDVLFSDGTAQPYPIEDHFWIQPWMIDWLVQDCGTESPEIDAATAKFVKGMVDDFVPGTWTVLNVKDLIIAFSEGYQTALKNHAI